MGTPQFIWQCSCEPIAHLLLFELATNHHPLNPENLSSICVFIPATAPVSASISSIPKDAPEPLIEQRHVYRPQLSQCECHHAALLQMISAMPMPMPCCVHC